MKLIFWRAWLGVAPTPRHADDITWLFIFYAHLDNGRHICKRASCFLVWSSSSWAWHLPTLCQVFSMLSAFFCLSPFKPFVKHFAWRHLQAKAASLATVAKCLLNKDMDEGGIRDMSYEFICLRGQPKSPKLHSQFETAIIATRCWAAVTGYLRCDLLTGFCLRWLVYTCYLAPKYLALCWAKFTYRLAKG